MFGIGGFKLLIILIAVLVLVGPDKLPEIGRTIGKFIAMFKAAQADMERMIKAGMDSADPTGLSSVLSDPLGTSGGKDASPTAAAAIYAAADDDEEEEEE